MSKKELNKVIYSKYIINKTELIHLSNLPVFKNLLKNVENVLISIESTLLHKKNSISLIENFILNIDLFIYTFKNHFILNQLEYNYIFELFLYSPEFKNLLNSKFYFDGNEKYYDKIFKRLIVNKFKENLEIIKKELDFKLEDDLFKFLKDIVNCKRRNVYHLFIDINDSEYQFMLMQWKNILEVYFDRKKFLDKLGL